MTYKILSLDGGGSWAVLQVMALAALYGEATTGHRVLADFNLVAANSGGSITLGGLLEDRTLADLRDNFFLSEAARRSVFVERGGLASLPQAILHLGPKYSTKAKLAGLQKLLSRYGATRLSELGGARAGMPDLVICTFDYDRLRGILLRSNRSSPAASFTNELDPTLAEAIHASTDAPVNFFDTPAALPQAAPRRQFWDGGVAGYNNPVMVAVVEALASGHAASSIRALSIGTGSVFLPADPDRRLGALGQPPRRLPRNNFVEDLLADVATLAAAVLDDPPDTASYHAHVALGGKLPTNAAMVQASGPVTRLNPLIQPVRNAAGNWVAPEGIGDFAALAALEADAVAQADVLRIVELGHAWLANTVPNQAIRANRDTLACEVGQPTFDRALAAWQGVGGLS